jgi:pilus assembly protein Flp/PilA
MMLSSAVSLPSLVEIKNVWGRVNFRVIKDRSGVTAIEYGLIAALIAVAAVVVMGTVGTDLSGVFDTVATNL